MKPSSPPALPTHGRPIERLTARRRAPLEMRWTVEIGIMLMLLDLLWWIRR